MIRSIVVTALIVFDTVLLAIVGYGIYLLMK